MQAHEQIKSDELGVFKIKPVVIRPQPALQLIQPQLPPLKKTLAKSNSDPPKNKPEQAKPSLMSRLLLQRTEVSKAMMKTDVSKNSKESVPRSDMQAAFQGVIQRKQQRI